MSLCRRNNDIEPRNVVSGPSSIGARGDGQGWNLPAWDMRRTAVAGGMLGIVVPVADLESCRMSWEACQRCGAACQRPGRGHWRECPRGTRQPIHHQHRSSRRARER